MGRVLFLWNEKLKNHYVSQYGLVQVYTRLSDLTSIVEEGCESILDAGWQGVDVSCPDQVGQKSFVTCRYHRHPKPCQTKILLI